MKDLLLVGFGGFTGAILRYKIGGMILHHTDSLKFPVATFAVNVTGCLIAGILMSLAIKHQSFTPEIKLLLFTGLLGGFTTFSAFGVDTFYLIERSEWLIAGLYVTLTVIAGMAALFLGSLSIR